MAGDPYLTLGVAASAPDAEVRAAYRRLVQLHHPDHNGGSAESARRFEEVQEAYAEVRKLRASGARPAGGARSSGGARRAGGRPSGGDPGLDARMADLERELREAKLARERARRAAREAAAGEARERAAARARDREGGASDEELGYIKTDDTFSKILSDARDELFGRAGEVRDGVREEVREHRVRDNVADLIDDLASRLRGEKPDKE
jgi:curved DNA-binding protein CbpA